MDSKKVKVMETGKIGKGLIAIEDIKKGEQLTFDYEMTEDSDWVMKCSCGTPSCRKLIGAYKNMPKKIRKKYEGYISEWLIEKYG